MSKLFDTVHNRANTQSLKWDVEEDELPMWVADMDFPTTPAVTQALMERAKSGIYGYSIIPDEWAEGYMNWWKTRHEWAIQSEWLIFTTGVVPSITSSVKRLTNLGDNVVVQTPVYNIFFNSIENGGRHALENPLIYENGGYRMDFEDLENKLALETTTLMLLCNPHNPTGNVWTKEELQRVGELCAKYHVIVLSDEIHCDIVNPKVHYTPFASVSETCRNNSVTCIAASKAFNLAGLQSAAVVIPDERIRQIVNRGLNSDEVAEPNCFAVTGTVAAFSKGEAWLDECNAYIQGNKEYVTSWMKESIPEVHVVPSDATYLLWIDCQKICEDTDKLCVFIRRQTGLYLSAGAQFHGNGQRFVRMNLACPRSVVEEGMERLLEGIEKYKRMQKE